MQLEELLSRHLRLHLALVQQRSAVAPGLRSAARHPARQPRVALQKHQRGAAASPTALIYELEQQQQALGLQAQLQPLAASMQSAAAAGVRVAAAHAFQKAALGRHEHSSQPEQPADLRMGADLELQLHQRLRSPVKQQRCRHQQPQQRHWQISERERGPVQLVQRALACETRQGEQTLYPAARQRR